MPASRIELSRSALANNLAFVRGQLREGAALCVVVKGNAYGHGTREYAGLCLDEGVEHFAVYTGDEARELHEVAAGRASIQTMGFLDTEEIDWALANGVEMWTFDIPHLRRLLDRARATGHPARLHVELETGMNRTGLHEGETGHLLQLLGENSEHHELCGLCTHYAGAENIANHVRIRKQYRRFRNVVRELRAAGLEPARVHSACSAAMLRYPDTQMDMVRSGILSYGLWPSPEQYVEYLQKQEEGGGVAPPRDPLNRVITWKSELMSVKKVKRGEYIGYGSSFLSYEPRTIGIVPVGYAHGYARALSNQGLMLVNGRRAQVVGTVNMHATTLDVSSCGRGGTGEAKAGDEVVIIGRGSEGEVSVASFSERSRLVNYELLSRIPRNLPRLVVD